MRKSVLLLGFIFAFAVSLSAQTNEIATNAKSKISKAESSVLAERNETEFGAAVAPSEMTIIRKGLVNDSESAIYSIYWKESVLTSDDDFAKKFTVCMNKAHNKSAEGDYAECKVVLQESTGVYKVVEESWTWAYEPKAPEAGEGAEIGPNYAVCVIEPGAAYTFIFDGAAKTDVPKHAESRANNVFDMTRLLVNVSVTSRQDNNAGTFGF